MARFQVGTVCVLVGATREPYLGKECTIVGAHGEYLTRQFKKQEGYMVTVQGFGEEQFFSFQEGLRLKRYPPDTQQWLTEKVNNLLQSNKDIVLEEV
jgi:hypothetical protein